MEKFDGKICIGRDSYPIIDRYFNGVIDEVRIYDRALNVDEIDTIYVLDTTMLSTSKSMSGTEITKYLSKAYEELEKFGNWHQDATVKTKHGSEIAGLLLEIARLEQAKKKPVEKVLDEYYEITKQFPRLPEAIGALCHIITLDAENGLKYAEKFLEKDATGTNTIRLYGTVIRNYMAELDYVNVNKYVKLFIDKCTSAKDGSKLMVQLMGSIGLIEDYEKFYRRAIRIKI